MNIVAAKAQAFVEADTKEFEHYAQAVIANAKAMSEVFLTNGFKVQCGGTDSHIVLIDLSDKPYSGRVAADLLEKYNITVNKNGIPNDKRSFVETSGIRIGTAAETTRGHGVHWFKDLAEDIIQILESNA
jgi:glycine hydroxymethyltransferase